MSDKTVAEILAELKANAEDNTCMSCLGSLPVPRLIKAVETLRIEYIVAAKTVCFEIGDDSKSVKADIDERIMEILQPEPEPRHD